MMKQYKNKKLTVFHCLLLILIFLSLATVTGYIFRLIGFPETNIVIVYILAVLLTARFSDGYIYGIIASVISIFAYNYFFTAPYFTFAVNDPSYIVTFVIMTITSILTSTLTTHVKKSTIKAQEKEAETKQERYRGNLLRAISHDLRTPLSGIMGTSEMLMDMTNKNDPRYNLANEIHNDANWLHSLVENILSLTKLQDGKLVLKKSFEAVEEVVGGAVHHVVQHTPEREVNIDIPEELMLVPMDAKLIEQVIINLLENAIKHTQPEDEISICVKKENNNVSFIVADRGEGIVDEDLPKIFQMFYTTNSRHVDAQNGIGLGLVICEAVVKAHGGNIYANNRLDGKGAEFVFKLPMEVTGNE